MLDNLKNNEHVGIFAKPLYCNKIAQLLYQWYKDKNVFFTKMENFSYTFSGKNMGGIYIFPYKTTAARGWVFTRSIIINPEITDEKVLNQIEYFTRWEPAEIITLNTLDEIKDLKNKFTEILGV